MGKIFFVKVMEGDVAVPRGIMGILRQKMIEHFTSQKQGVKTVNPLTEMAKTMARELRDMASLTTNKAWNIQGYDQGITVHTYTHPTTQKLITRGQALINHPIGNVIQFLLSPVCKQYMQDDNEIDEIIEQIDEETTISYVKTKKSKKTMMVAARDFVLLGCKTKMEDDSYVIAARSIDYNYSGPDKEAVRGHLYDSGWVLTPVGENKDKTQAVFVSHCDPKISVPDFVLNGILTNKAFNVKFLRDGFLAYLKDNKTN
eukprot:TRINITY_DN1535_c0_g2_i1.p1 TRINITY_DN1535_c0_g2~~TRINITY_DN1535_c0_g2_i1.p1  ORF type:complete len:258 (+),score=45.72 TRINITY_DN1535_c0_g2_i1:99-872(+)